VNVLSKNEAAVLVSTCQESLSLLEFDVLPQFFWPSNPQHLFFLVAVITVHFYKFNQDISNTKKIACALSKWAADEKIHYCKCGGCDQRPHTDMSNSMLYSALSRYMSDP
jgi:hypothetical protein